MIQSTDIRNRLKTNGWVSEAFPTLQDISYVCANCVDAGRELVVYALDRRDQLSEDLQLVLDDLAMRVGLYPYVENLSELSLAKAIEHASHTAEGSMSQIVFHSSQAKIFEKLLDGRSVVLSAPTSYGKSLLIDAYIAASELTNVVIIVPTIALIEETRRRMGKFSEKYKIITTKDQTFGDKNILVLTQERYLAMREDLPDPDFFVIDEFYKLDLSGGKDRSNLLNQAFLHLQSTGSQYYLLGPSIDSISPEAESLLDCDFIHEEFNTVALDIHYLKKEPSKPRSLATKLSEITGQTLVYCKSPQSTRNLMTELIEIGYSEGDVAEELVDAADWAADNFHQDWLVSQALRHGVGIHHGRVPRALARFMVRAFEDRKLQTLVCTSTLIEGVNTAARNVVVYDNKVDRKKLDFFTFNNISGRSGRMFKHYVGHVYLFEPPPEKELPFVDIPAFNPTAATPSSILLQKDYSTLPEEAQNKINPLRDQQVVPFDLLTRHSGIEPEYLLEAGRKFLEMSTTSLSLFAWAGYPTYDQLGAVCGVIWSELNGAAAARNGGMLTSNMMNYWLWDLYKKADVSWFRREMIRNQIEGMGKSADDAVEDVLRFLRNWASFNFPKYIVAVNDLATVELDRRSMERCDYTPFATEIENLFQPHTFATLEEYGLPVEVATKLAQEQVFDRNDSLDTVIRKIRRADRDQLRPTRFERNVLRDFLEGV